MRSPADATVDSTTACRRRRSGVGQMDQSSSSQAAREDVFSVSTSSSGQTISRLRVGETLQPIRQTASDLYLFKDNVSGRSALVATENTRDIPQNDPQHTRKKSQSPRTHEREVVPKTHDTKAVRHQQTGAHDHSHHQHGEQSSADHRTSSKQSKRRSTQISCHECGRVSSPEWRSGPDGPGTLCNVCGLVFAKREAHRRDRADGRTRPRH